MNSNYRAINGQGEASAPLSAPLLSQAELKTRAQPAPQSMGGAAEGGNLSRYGLPDFTRVLGEHGIPYVEPNMPAASEERSLNRIINGTDHNYSATWTNALCCITGVGSLYLLSKMHLVRDGFYGFVNVNGKQRILMPGRYVLSNVFTSFTGTSSCSEDVIKNGPITIVRVAKGKLGFASDNGNPVVLLPGRHARNDGKFIFQSMYDMSADITFGPIKMFTVNTGEVRVCYDQGRVVIWTEGIYAVNSNTFIVKGKLTTQQQNVRFSRHRVLLDGGISMLVEGLLTYKIIDVQKLMEEIGDTALLRAIQDVTKAELSRVFANVHLEELSNRNAQSHEPGSTSGADAKKALLGDAPQTVDDREEHTFTRSGICHEVVGHVQPFASKWGVQIVNFQLESTTLADERYGREYEEASLGLAKSKANRRAVEVNNEIMLQKAEAEANTLRIVAEGKAQATIVEAKGNAQATVVEAKGDAEARQIEATSRNAAAQSMTDQFSKDYAMQGLKVDMLGAIKASTVTVLPDSVIGQALGAMKGEHKQ